MAMQRYTLRVVAAAFRLCVAGPQLLFSPARAQAKYVVKPLVEKTIKHPGSEAFYVVEGRLRQRTPHGVRCVEAGETMNGHEGGMAMEVFNGGISNLDALIMFVVDVTRPFSTPAMFEAGH